MVIAYADVRDLTAARLVRDLGQLPRVIVGSPPCQDISAANARGKGVDGERSGLFFEATRLIGECRPDFFALENSPRLRTRGYDRVAAELERHGYRVEPWVVGAENLLAPHQRRRVWIVGYRPDADRNRQPAQPLHEKVARVVGADGNADSARLAIGEGLGEHACAKLKAIVGAVGAIGAAWNSGPSGHFSVADGVDPRVAKKLIAGIGDCVLAPFVEIWARVMAQEFATRGPVLDLFHGLVGGWSLGMRRAGYEIAAICEIDDWRRAVAVEHHRSMT